MEIFEEEDIILKMRIVLHFLTPAKYGSPAMGIPEEYMGYPPGQLHADLVQR